jgi:hypothetical protein
MAARALQITACLYYGYTAFITNNRRLARLGLLIEILILDDFA